MRKFLIQLLAMIPFLGAEMPFETILDTSGLEIKTPSLQGRKTEKMRLANGMGVYLISDPGAEKSACAASINVGSWQDPEQFPGLAHLLEHMLFLGTEKYPESGGLSTYLSSHNGKNNALTGSNYSAYMFSVDSAYFAGAMDRLADFFIAPLLDPSLVASELVNIDQEFAICENNDGWREIMIVKELCNPEHPHAKFSIGNAKTLGKIPASRVRSWFLEHYSASRMQLVVYGPQSLEEMQDLVLKTFAHVPDRQVVKSQELPEFFLEDSTSKITYINPIKHIDELSVFWTMPKEFLDDTTKSLDLIAYALDRGQKNNLAELLKQEGLIDKMSISTSDIGKEIAFFTADFSLTEKGLQEKEQVITHLFSAIAMLKNSPIPSYLHEEKNEMDRLSYAYQNRENPFHFVKKHALGLLQEDLATYPRKTLLANSFSKEKIGQALAHLTPENAYIICVSDPAKTAVAYDKKEQWMGVSYTQKKISKATLSSWEKAPLHSSILMPPPNIYIPRNLTIVEKNLEYAQPTKLIDHPLGTIFFLQDHEFSSPEVMHLLHIHTPNITKAGKNAVMMDLYEEVMTQKLYHTLLSAKAAGLQCSFTHEKGAFHLSVHGYSEKAPLLMEECLKTILFSPIDSSLFSLAKASVSKHLENGTHELPVVQAVGLLKTFLEEGRHTKEEKAVFIEDISYEEFMEFRQSLFKEAYIKGFLSGNLTRKDAEVIWLDAVSLLEANTYPKEAHPTFVSRFFPEEEGPLCVKKETSSLGTGVLLTIDQGDFTFTKKAAQEILSKGLHEGFFKALRTEQKTGYLAQGFPVEKGNHLYQSFCVQSNSHSSLDLLYRFELFLEQFLQDFATIFPKERFSAMQNSLVSELEKPYRNLTHKTSVFDEMAFEKEENFSYREQKKKALEELDYTTFSHLAKTWIARTNTKRLAIFYEGKMGSPFAYDTFSKEAVTKMLEKKS